jgi:hypothetical protein
MGPSARYAITSLGDRLVKAVRLTLFKPQPLLVGRAVTRYSFWTGRLATLGRDVGIEASQRGKSLLDTIIFSF